jgi:predicted AAA+ superfamily ATPase
MEHVGLNNVGTYHKKFGWKKKNNKNILCRVSKNGTRQSILCRVLGVGHSAKFFLKNTKPFFAECLSLLSAGSRTVGKVYF